MGQMGAPGNIEMTHIHKFRSLRTKVRRVLVGISIQNQRHAISPQTARRRKGSWLDKWVPPAKTETTNMHQDRSLRTISKPLRSGSVTSPFKSLARNWGHGDEKLAFRVHETMGPQKSDHLACTKRPVR